MTTATAASLTRLAARDELADVAARLAVVRDELARFAPDPFVAEHLKVASAATGSVVRLLGRTVLLPVEGPTCACGHTAGEHVIRSERLTVCGECGCPGWAAL